MNHEFHERGFTLVELLIVMVIASILAMIAVPSYQASVIKSRRADARVVLNDTAQKLERCYTQYGAYNSVDCPIADDEEIPSRDGYYVLTVDVPDAATYTLTAAPEGTQAEDGKCGSLGLSNTGERTITGDDDVAHCW
jgi:type IV pilus assembly protein PilE